jgi:hypothetical protein
MPRIPRRQGREEPKIGPSDSSDDYRVVDESEAGLGGGLDQAEEARRKRTK